MALLLLNHTIQQRHGVQNVAIVAHVNDGKTTLVGELFKVAASSIDANNSVAATTCQMAPHPLLP